MAGKVRAAAVKVSVTVQASAIDRPLPSNIEAERCILGAILIDNHVLNAAVQILRSEDFFLPQHRHIFEQMIQLGEKRHAIDTVTLMDELSRNRKLESAGGVAYLSPLADGLPRVNNVEHYARIVKEKADRRAAIHRFEALRERAYDDDLASLLQHSNEVHQLLRAKIQDANAMKLWAAIPDVLKLSLREIEWTVEGLFANGTVNMLAGLPGLCKSFFVMILALRVDAGIPFLGRSCTKNAVLVLDRENPLDVVSSRLRLLGARPSERLKFWGLWNDSEPPLIGDPRLLQVSKELKPLVVFDSFVRFIGDGVDENDTSQIAPVMSHLRELATAGATVVFLHHKPKNGAEYRGSTDILGGCDVGYQIDRDKEDSDRLILSVIKSRLGEKFKIHLEPDFSISRDFLLATSREDGESRDFIERLKEIIRAEPGITQENLVAKSGLPRKRAREKLKSLSGTHWLVKDGEKQSSRFYPIGNQEVLGNC